MTAHLPEKTKKDAKWKPLTQKYMTAHFSEKSQKEKQSIP